MTRPCLLLGALLVACIGTPTTASADDPCKVNLALALSGHHDPPTRERLEVICVDPGQALLALVQDRTRPMWQRQRAAWALGDFPSTQAAALLESLATQSAQLPGLRRAALIGIARMGDRGPYARLRSALILDPGMRRLVVHVDRSLAP